MSSGVLAAGWRPLSSSRRLSPLLSLHCSRVVFCSSYFNRSYESLAHQGSNGTRKVCLVANGRISAEPEKLRDWENESKMSGLDMPKRNLHTLFQKRRTISTFSFTQRPRKVTFLIRKSSLAPKTNVPLHNPSTNSSSPIHISTQSDANTNTNTNNTSDPNTKIDVDKDNTRRAPPSKLLLYNKLGKVQLTFGTAIMSACGYLAVGRFSFVEFMSVFFGTWILGMSGGAANQIIERDLDSQMARTKNRPLPSGHISLKEAYMFSTVTGGVGMGLLWFGTTPLAASVGAATWGAYIVYTFSKTRTVYNTHIGAVSGALPLVIGWTAAGGLLMDFQCLSEFAAMWFWQFAHFNVISWQYRKDYQRAGFMMQSGIDMAKEKGQEALGGLYAYTGAVFFALVPFVSIMHGYNSPVFLGSYVATVPFVLQMRRFWKNPSNTKTINFRRWSFSPLAVGGITLAIYLVFFALSSTRWGEDGTKDFFGYSLSRVLPPKLSVFFCRHCPVRLKMDNNRMAASHSPTGLDPQFHSQDEMWRVFHVLSLACPTYYYLPKIAETDPPH
jgi:protoheme IX farnesyltransferase